MKTKAMCLNFKVYAFLLMILVGSIAFSSCNSDQRNSKKDDFYTCPMDRQIRQKMPGNCPICKMELVDEGSLQLHHINVPVKDVVKATNESILSKVKITQPIKTDVAVNIQGKGLISYDTRNLEVISARINGRIDKLYVRYLNEKVTKGQKLFDIYSPELVTAQENYLYIKKDLSSSPSLKLEARQRLSLLGLNDQQIRQLELNNRASSNFIVYSQVNGYLINAAKTENDNNGMIRDLSPLENSIELKEGMYVKAGEPLLRIVDNSNVWALVKIFNSDQLLIKQNLQVQVNASGMKVIGKIDLVEPFYEGEVKALSVRVNLPNNTQRFHVNEWVDAIIYGDTVSGLWIPQSAVLDLGRDQIVFVKAGKTFVAQKIVTGITYQHQVQVLSGLDEKTTIALQAQYLIDSESFIQPERP